MTPVIDVPGLLVLLAFAGLCHTAARSDRAVLRAVATVLMLTLCAALFLHVVPGFNNARLVANVVLSPGALPYSQYVNLDKGIAGMLLLGLYARGAEATRQPILGAFAWRFVLMVAVVMALSLAFGYVRWDPKLPSWWPVWLLVMVFLTALPEEALFRAVVQTAIERWFAGSSHAMTIAIVMAGVIFGLAHLAGGPLYVVLASVAGMGYGWIYASTRSITAAIAAHAGLNTLHFFFFTYPPMNAP